jgi:hypothetical protein
MFNGAVARGRAAIEVVVDGGSRPPGVQEVPADRASIVSFLLLRGGGGSWRIAAFPNTRAAWARRTATCGRAVRASRHQNC